MKCIGCGVKIQTSDESLPGFIDESHLLEGNEEVYCKRCFDIIHYNRRYTVSLDENNIVSKMQNLFQQHPHDLVCVLIDALDLYGSLTKRLTSILENMKTIILINKIDLIPKSINVKRLEQNILEISKSLNLKVVSVMAISSKRQDDILKVLRKIDKLQNNSQTKKNNFKNCYIVGHASVGKSTFINMVKDVCGINHHLLTTSDQFQTTQDIIKIRINAGLNLYDTPGLINYGSFNYYLNYESTKKLRQKNFLHVKVYQLMANQTLFLGGLVQIDILQAEKISLSLFIPDNLYVHRTKLENAQTLKTKQQFKLLIPPYTLEEQLSMGSIHERIFNLENGKSYDLVVSGLGFIHIIGQNPKIRVRIPEKIDYKLMESII